MLKKSFSYVIAFQMAAVFFCANLNAADLFSPSTSDMFVEVSEQLAVDSDDMYDNAAQVAVFLKAAERLNPQFVVPFDKLVKLASLDPSQDFSDIVKSRLIDTTPSELDIKPTLTAITYLLENKHSREDKEILLNSLLGRPGGYNDFLASEIAMELGLLSAEKVDASSAANFFYQSWMLNHYNVVAFDNLIQLAPSAVSVADYGAQLRREMQINPYNINSALRFAQFAWKYQMFETAAKAYAYCADIFRYQNPNKQIPVYIYLPWVTNAMAAKDQYQSLTDIIKILRNQATFDLRAESMYLLANPLGVSQKEFDSLLQKAMEINADDSSKVSNLDLAWYCCFVKEDASMALGFANKAYSNAQSEPAVKSVFAYALLINNQLDMTQELISGLTETDQVAALTDGLFQLDKGQSSEAIKSLKTCVSLDPASIIARKAMRIITENGSDYISVQDPIELNSSIAKQFNGRVVPEFTMPDKMFAAALSLSGNEFLYTSPINASLTITNNSPQPMIITPGAMINGVIRVDASVSGDINGEFPAIILKEIRPGRLIDTGKDLYIDLKIEQGAFAQLLKQHPQADCEITVTVYIDPVDMNGKIVNNLPSLKPISVSLKRNRVNLTSQNLMQRLEAYEKGKEGQKIHSAMLFSGLLAEQLKNNQSQQYRIKVVPQEVLYSAFVRSLNNDSWNIKTFSSRYLVGLPLSYDTVNALSQNLYDKNWTVRLIIVDVLASSQTQGFDQVLEWIEKSDSEPLVREMAEITRKKTAR